MASWPVLDRVARVWAAEPRALGAVQRAVSLSACAMAVALTRLPDGRHDDESDDLTTSLYSVNKTQHFYSYQVTTSRTTVRQTGHLPSLWKGTLSHFPKCLKCTCIFACSDETICTHTAVSTGPMRPHLRYRPYKFMNRLIAASWACCPCCLAMRPGGATGAGLARRATKSTKGARAGVSRRSP